MILRSTYINPMQVSNDIQCPSYDVGTLVAKARQGGRSGYAFNIAENGSPLQDGTLIAGALPYWNIYANEQPGQWRLPSTASGDVYHELRRDNLNRYIFQLEGFAGHNTNASAPVPMSNDLTFTKYGSYVDHSFAAKINLGDYDWKKLNGVTHCKVKVYYPGGVLYSESNVLPCVRNTMMTFDGFTMRIPTNTVYTETYPTKIVLCQSDGTDLGCLPIQGNITISVQNAVDPYMIRVFVNGNPKAFTMGNYIDAGSSARAIGTYTGLVNANFKTLDKIEYSIIDASTNAVLSTTTVTDFGLRESPWTLDYYNAGDIETFDVATNRVYPSTGQYVRAFMYYV